MTMMIEIVIGVFLFQVFRYNKDTDELDLCMEPLGHFPVGPDTDLKVQQAKDALLEGASNSAGGTRGGSPGGVLSSGSASSFHTLSELSSNVKNALGSGSSGVAVNQPMKWPGAGHVAAFSGKGHTLSGNNSTAVAEPSHTATSVDSPRHGPMDVDSDEDVALFDPDRKPDKMDVDAKASESDKPSTSIAQDSEGALFERVRPGYTRLNPSVTNEVNMQSEMFQTIASSIQSALNEDPEVKVSQINGTIKVHSH